MDWVGVAFDGFVRAVIYFRSVFLGLKGEENGFGLGIF